MPLARTAALAPAFRPTGHGMPRNAACPGCRTLPAHNVPLTVARKWLVCREETRDEVAPLPREFPQFDRRDGV